MRRALAVCLFLACAHKRAEPTEGVATAAEPMPIAIATRLQAPDAGPFDFSRREEEKKWMVTGDMAHPGQMSGYR